MKIYLSRFSKSLHVLQTFDGPVTVYSATHVCKAQLATTTERTNASLNLELEVVPHWRLVDGQACNQTSVLLLLLFLLFRFCLSEFRGAFIHENITRQTGGSVRSIGDAGRGLTVAQ